MSVLSDIGGVANAATTLVGSILGYRANKKSNAANLQIARETNENEYRMFQEGNVFNRQMAEYQNEWNSAAAQRKRLEDAGYNPASLMGSSQIPAASASSLPVPQLQRAEMRPFDPSPYLAILGQNVAAFAAAKKDMTEAKGNEIDNANKQAQYDAQIADLVARKLLTNEQADALRQEISFKDANWDALSKQIENMAYETQQKARVEQLNADILEIYGKQQADANVLKTLNEARLFFEQGDTEQSKRLLMKIQGDVEKANVAISQMAASALANLNYQQADLLHEQSIYQKALNETYKLFGKGQAAVDFLDSVMEANIKKLTKQLLDAKLPWKDVAGFCSALGSLLGGSVTIPLMKK